MDKEKLMLIPIFKCSYCNAFVWYDSSLNWFDVVFGIDVCSVLYPPRAHKPELVIYDS